MAIDLQRLENRPARQMVEEPQITSHTEGCAEDGGGAPLQPLASNWRQSAGRIDILTTQEGSSVGLVRAMWHANAGSGEHMERRAHGAASAGSGARKERGAACVASSEFESLVTSSSGTRASRLYRVRTVCTLDQTRVTSAGVAAWQAKLAASTLAASTLATSKSRV